MPLPLHQLLTNSYFRFRNAREFLCLRAHCIDAVASSWCVNFFARCNTRYKQSVGGDDIILFAHYYFY